MKNKSLISSLTRAIGQGLNRVFNRSKDLLFIAPLLPWWRRRLSGKAMVYLYHRIEPIGEHPFLDAGGSPVTDPHEFRRDIRALKAMGARFVTFSELPNCDFNNDQFYVAICVDDGFQSNYAQGTDVCDQEGITQTVFQCASMLAGSPMVWEHQLYFCYFHTEFKQDFRRAVVAQPDWPDSYEDVRESVHPNKITEFVSDFAADRHGLSEEIQACADKLYPSEDDLRKAHQRGHEIASHGDKHWPRGSITAEEFSAELTASKMTLEAIVGRSISAFSYPFNDYQAGDDLLCAKVYQLIATVDGGPVTARTPLTAIARNTFPGPAKNKLRHRRWLYTGRI